jgi:hypothetical protein
MRSATSYASTTPMAHDVVNDLLDQLSNGVPPLPLGVNQAPKVHIARPR